MKILVLIPSYSETKPGEKSTLNGVDYHRLLNPHKALAKFYPNEVDLYQAGDIDSDIIDGVDSIDFIKRFDLIIGNRTMSKILESKKVADKIKKAGVKFVLDMDDDFQLPTNHILYNESKRQGVGADVKDSLRYADVITCTHQLLADEIQKEVGKKETYIIPNGLPPLAQFEPKPFKSDLKVVFGWSGSITHFDDIMLMHDSLLALYTDYRYKDEFKMIYGGYAKGDEESEAMLGVLSCKGKASAKNFEIFPSTDVHNYAYFYDNINVALIPLKNTRFNNMKSNLKLLEAGFKKKAVIVSDVHPYNTLLTDKNCLKAKNKHDWFKNMVKLIRNPNMIEDLSEQLYLDVQVQSIDKIAELRYNTYKQILKK